MRVWDGLRSDSVNKLFNLFSEHKARSKSSPLTTYIKDKTEKDRTATPGASGWEALRFSLGLIGV